MALADWVIGKAIGPAGVQSKIAVEFRVDATRKETPMAIRPDPTFHASPKLAMEAPPEEFAYTLLLSPDFSKPDALAVTDAKPGSPTYSQIVHTVTMPYKGDEFHHFGWNACSSSLSPLAGHSFLERRYLIIPGIRSSRIYVVDTKPHPTQAKIHKIIEPEEMFRKTGYSRPHTVHCGPEGIYISTLGGGGKAGTEGPPGVFIMDCETFDILGRWEIDRGPQTLHYDFWWNLPRDYMVSSEWGLPPQFENGIVPEDLLSNKYGHHVHFWDLRARRNVQTIDLGANHQMPLEVRPAHDPVREYGFVGVVVDTTNLEGSIWTWWREDGKFQIEKTATIPPEPAPKDQLPPLLQGFGAAPPLVSDIDLSMDDKFLYVACWGTGEMRQYDVTEPRKPKLAGSVHVGGIVRRTAHPNGKAFAGGPQMVEISRDGKRVYWTNSLYSTWDAQFYPDGVPGAEVMAIAGPAGGLELAKDYWVNFPDGYRAHQIRLDGGDCSTDSFCYPSA
jgi:methanethiol oxidase